jgi:hypothetical protein
MTLDPAKDFNQVIEDFERLQADYQAALTARANAEDNERRLREAHFHEQQFLYLESQKRHRRGELVQETISRISEVIQEIEWGHCSNLGGKLTPIESQMDWLLRTGVLRDGK